MAKWTEDVTYKFVQEYVKYEYLYNCKHSNYRIKEVRDAALLRISEAMNIPGFGSKEVYTKIRNLKSTYSQELKKVKQSTKSGAGTDEVYNPHIKWFKLLDDALKNVNVQCKDSQSNMELDSQHESLDGEEPSTSQQNQSAEKNNPDATPEPQRNHDEEEQRKSPIPRKRTIRDLNRLVNKVKNVADTINTPMQTVTESEFDIFGKSVAAQLKSMPMHQAIEGQMFIQNYLCNLRLRQMGHGTSNYPYSPSPNSMYTGSPSPTYSMPPSALQNFPYTQPPQNSPYTQPPRQSSTPIPTDNVDNISPADQSHLPRANNDNTITLYSENNDSQLTLPEPPEPNDDILAVAVASIYQ